MTGSSRILVVAACAVAGVVCAAQGLPPLRDAPRLRTEDLRRKPFSDVQVFISLDQMIENEIVQPTPEQLELFGEHAYRKNYGGAFFISTGTSCTASLLGPQALITAQHCLPGAGPILLGAKDLRAFCMKHSFYAKATGARWEDLAMCWVNQAIALKRYETISTDPSLAKRGANVLIGGYGLTATTGPVGSVFNIGAATIEESGDTLRTKGATARIGDSGGELFAIPGDRKRRFLIGVVKQESLADRQTSFSTALFAKHAHEFVRWWVQHQQKTFSRTIDVCGITKTDATCQ